MGASQNKALRFLFPLFPTPLCLDSSFCVCLLTFKQIPNSSQVHKPQLYVSACPLETSSVPVGILNSAYLKADSFAKIIKWSYFRKVALFSLFLPDQNRDCQSAPRALWPIPCAQLSCEEGPPLERQGAWISPPNSSPPPHSDTFLQ